MTAEAVSRLDQVVLVTGNPGKLAEARRLSGVAIDAADLDLPEIQSLDIQVVLRAKGQQAFDILQRPVLVDETALELDALGGFPGCLVKWMLAAVGADGIARTALAMGEPRATARCALWLYDGGEGVLAEGTARGRLVLPGRGAAGFGWDAIFEPDGLDRTFAELSPPEKDEISHRGAAWRRLRRRLAAV